jgi:RNA polymerase sigma factor (sigma-70 family)
MMTRHAPPRIEGVTVSPFTADSDKHLLWRWVNATDHVAFAELQNRHSPNLLRIARRMLGSSDSDQSLSGAEDVVQDVFIQTILKAGGILTKPDTPDDLGRLLARITRNLCYTACRKKRLPRASGYEVEHLPSPSKAGVSASEADALERCQARLDPLDREVLHYRFECGWSAEDIAEELNMTAPEVYARTRRGGRRLRVCMEQQLNGQ